MSPNKKVRLITGDAEKVEGEVNSLHDLYQPLGIGFYVVGDQLVATATLILRSELRRPEAQPFVVPAGFDPRRQ